MKKNLASRLLSMSAAAALCCSAAFSGGPLFISSAANEPNYSDDEIVEVIIKLKGNTLLDEPEVETMGTDYLSTPEAAASTSIIKAYQDEVADKIAVFYPDIDVKTSLFLTMNGFECTLPESLIPQVEALSEVEYVYRNQVISTPQMSIAPNYSSAPEFYQETGCYGEGKVITIIDTEFDITHPMFSALEPDIETAITKNDIRKVIDTLGLNVDITANKAYLNSKVPYCANYCDDPYGDVPNDSDLLYHGTHVAGIAAGNEYVYEGTTYAGIAKNSQLILIAAGTKKRTIYDIAAVNAFEDALKLGTDVISMSFGFDAEEYDHNPFYDCFDAAEKAGVIVLQSAGNSSKSGDGAVTSIDEGMINNFEKSSVLAVASADNDTTFGSLKEVISYEGGTIESSISVNSTNYEKYYITDNLQGEFDFETCGLGKPEDFEGVDLSGKIAVIHRGEINFQNKYDNATAAGAVGVIIVNYENSALVQLSVTSPCNMCMISYEDYQLLLESGDNHIRLSKEKDTVLDWSMSSYSSWGPLYSLDLRPDITGIGGDVGSAAYNEQIVSLSGTSMSTPYTAGCAAVLLEYIDKSGITLPRKEKASYLRKLIMNSAEPISSDSLYVSPRNQGAGMVSLKNATNEKVLLSGDEGNAKVNLYDGVTDSFAFTLNAENISQEDVIFSSARLALTTNSYNAKEDINGETIYMIGDQIGFECTADLSEFLSIKAGEKKTAEITCTLDSELYNELSEIYKNGFFVEGFIVLDGADNCCTTSIPLLGFCGDWEAAPILVEGSISPTNIFGNKRVPNKESFLEELITFNKLKNTLPEDFSLTSGNYYDAAKEYLPSEDYEKLINNEQTLWVSPNDNGFNDQIALKAEFSRFCYADYFIFDENGELISTYTYDSEDIYPLKNNKTDIRLKVEDKLQDGKYQFQMEYGLGYSDKTEKKDLDLIIDRSSPEISAVISEKGGKRILSITASDNELDGVMIYGKSNKADESKPNFIADIPEILYLFSEPENKGKNYNLGSNSRIEMLLSGIENGDSYNFTDIFLPDDSGKVSFEYDITDLNECYVTAIDKAFNMTDYSVDKPSESIRKGIWVDENALYQFNSDGTLIIRSLSDNNEFSGEFSYSDEAVSFSNEGEIIDIIKIEKITDSLIQVIYDDKPSKLHFLTDEYDINEAEFCTKEEAMFALFTYDTKNNPLVSIDNDDIRYISGTLFEYTIHDFYDDNTNSVVGVSKYYIDLMNKTAVDNNGNAVDIFDTTINSFSAFNKGMWIENTGNDLNYYYFSEDKRSGYSISISDGKRTDFDFYFNDENKLCLVTGDNETAFSTKYFYEPSDASLHLLLTKSDGSVSDLVFDNSIRGLRFESYNFDELSDMASKDYHKRNKGRKVDSSTITVDEDGNVNIEIHSDDGTVLDTYKVDPVTGKGTNSAGDEIDLPQTGFSFIATVAVPICSVLIILGGLILLSWCRPFRKEKKYE